MQNNYLKNDNHLVPVSGCQNQPVSLTSKGLHWGYTCSRYTLTTNGVGSGYTSYVPLFRLFVNLRCTVHNIFNYLTLMRVHDCLVSRRWLELFHRFSTIFEMWKMRINSFPPRVAPMRQWIGSPLVHIMACRLFGAKSLSKPMLGNCQLDPSEQISVKFQSKCKYFHSRKCIWQYRLRNGSHLFQGEMS